MLRLDAPCPYCGKPKGTITPSKDGTPFPIPGDMLVCFDCLQPSMVENGPFGLAVRTLTPEERKVSKGDEELAAMVEYIRRKTGR